MKIGALNTIDDIRYVLIDLNNGRFQNTISASLDVSPATSTTVTHNLIKNNSSILIKLTPDPQSSAAMTDYLAGNVSISSVSNGSLVVAHNANASARTFFIEITEAA